MVPLAEQRAPAGADEGFEAAVRQDDPPVAILGVHDGRRVLEERLEQGLRALERLDVQLLLRDVAQADDDHLGRVVVAVSERRDLQGQPAVFVTVAHADLDLLVAAVRDQGWPLRPEHGPVVGVESRGDLVGRHARAHLAGEAQHPPRRLVLEQEMPPLDVHHDDGRGGLLEDAPRERAHGAIAPGVLPRGPLLSIRKGHVMALRLVDPPHGTETVRGHAHPPIDVAVG